MAHLLKFSKEENVENVKKCLPWNNTLTERYGVMDAKQKSLANWRKLQVKQVLDIVYLSTSLYS